MNLFSAFFAAIRRLTATVHSLADVGDAVRDDLQSARLPAPTEALRLTTADVDPAADTVDMPAGRRNGKAARR
jgi:hypothetical protein